MGECSYFFKMQFRNGAEAEKALKPVGNFMRQMMAAHDHLASEKGFEKMFPLVADYLKYIGTENLDGRDGTVSVGSDDSVLYRDEDTLSYAGYNTWHMEDWTPLMGYLEHRFRPIKTSYANEEDGCASLDSLNLYDWEGIVRSLLKRKALLLQLLHVHKDLDELLTHKLK
jgi:hypothetical protein